MLTPEILEKYRQKYDDQSIDRIYMQVSKDKDYKNLRDKFTAKYGSTSTGTLLDYYAYGTTNPERVSVETEEVDDKFTLGDVASNLGSGIKDVFKRRGEEVRQELETSGAVGEGSFMQRMAALPDLALFLTGDVIETGFELGMEGAKALGSIPATDTMGSSQEERDLMKQLGTKMLQAPGVKEGIEMAGKGFEWFEQWKQENPMAANRVEALVSIGDMIGFGKVAKAGLGGVERVGELADDVFRPIASVAEKGSKALEKSIAKNTMDTAVDLVTPIKGRAGSKKAVQELMQSAKRGELAGRKALPSQRTIAVAEEVAKVDGITNKNYMRDLDLMAKKQNEVATGLAEQLKKVDVNSDEVADVISREIQRELAEEAVSAPAAKLVDDMLDEMNRLIRRNPLKNLDDVWRIRRKVDDFVKTKSGDLPSGVKREGIDLFRGKMNEYIDMSVPEAGTRDAYRSWSLLNDGLETVANKATRQAETWTGRWIQKLERNPFIKTETRRDLLEMATILGAGVIGASTLGTIGVASAIVGVPSAIIYRGGKAFISPPAKKLYKKMLDAISEIPSAKRTGEVVIMQNQIRQALKTGEHPMPREQKLLQSGIRENRTPNLSGVQRGVDDVPKKAPPRESGADDVVYHGSTEKGLTQFKTSLRTNNFGVYFTDDKDIAKGFTKGGSLSQAYSPTDGQVYSVNIPKKELLDVSEFGAFIDNSNINAFLKKLPKEIRAASKEKITRSFTGPLSTNDMKTFAALETVPGMKDALQKAGYKGIKFGDWADGSAFDAYVVFDPQNTKILDDISPKALPSESEADNMVRFMKDNPDGFTVTLDGKLVTSGIAYSPYKGRELVLAPNELTGKTLRKYIIDNKDLLGIEGNNIGGWFNASDGRFYLDVSRVDNNFRDAIIKARQNDQIAIFDIGKRKEYLTEHYDDFGEEIAKAGEGGKYGGIGKGGSAAQAGKKSVKIKERTEALSKELGLTKSQAKQVSDDLAKIYDEAVKHKKFIDDVAEDVASKIDGAKVIKTPLKGELADGSFNPDRAISKSSQKLLNEGEVKIRDIARNSIMVNSIEDASKVLNMLSRRGIKLAPDKNFFQNPTHLGYRGMNYQVKIGKGGYEIQVQIPEILYYKQALKDARNLPEMMGDIFDEVDVAMKKEGLELGRGHDIFEEVRKYEDIAEREGRVRMVNGKNGKQKKEFLWTPEEETIVKPLIEESNRGYETALKISKQRSSR